jgi:hypothetical protein
MMSRLLHVGRDRNGTASDLAAQEACGRPRR